MTFLEELFPTDISFGAVGGPEYSTRITKMQNGNESRNIDWVYPKAKYNVAHAVKTKQQLESLIAFFRSKKGRAIGFRFKDWNDHSAQQQLIAIGDGMRRKFQLLKFYGNSKNFEKRVITKPVYGSVEIFINGKKNENFKVNYENGEITLKEAPAEKLEIRANFDFHVPVRFDVDWLAASEASHGKFSWNDIHLVEIL